VRYGIGVIEMHLAWMECTISGTILANYRIIASGAVRLGELKGCKHAIEGSLPAGLACACLFLHTGAW